MASPEGPLCLLISDSTLGGIVPYLGSDDDPPAVRCATAPFDQVERILLDGDDPCWHPSPDAALVWTRPRSASPTFARLSDGEAVDPAEILAEVDRFADLVRVASARVASMFVPTWTVPSYDRGLGLLNLATGPGPGYHLLKMNTRLIEALADSSNVHVLDAGRWMARVGPEATSPKLWHFGKIAYAPAVLRLAATEIKAALRGIAGRARKLVVLDLDDTIWGGVVGDLGWENLTLGGHHPAGEAFRAFQRALKALTNRGIVLGVVSKNTEAVALEAIDRHPEMVLRRGDLAGWRINWDDKAENVAALAREVNVGLDAVVFIDDNPAERARVREALPDVLVPDWPADKLQYEKALLGLDCFDAPSLNDEDRRRARSYAAARDREGHKQSAQSVESYLASLDLKVRADTLDVADLPRAAQLLNKTNQMNLATRRMTESQLMSWSREGAHRVVVFRVADRFDDYGLTGIVGLSDDGETARVADFVLSCRVMGRGVEEAMLKVLVDDARSRGLARVSATYVPTPRNAPCDRFFRERSGWRAEAADDKVEFIWDLRRDYPGPAHVEIRAGGPS